MDELRHQVQQQEEGFVSLETLVNFFQPKIVILQIYKVVLLRVLLRVNSWTFLLFL